MDGFHFHREVLSRPVRWRYLLASHRERAHHLNREKDAFKGEHRQKMRCRIRPSGYVPVAVPMNPEEG